MPSRLPVKVGVVGIGFGARVHLPAFQADRRCEVVALCASTEQRAAAAAARLQIPKAYGDWHRLAEDSEIDALAIAVPPALQPAIALAAAAGGKHVFCEKPVATSVDAAHAMLTAAQRAGVAHVVDFEFPEIDEWREAHRLLASGGLGQLRHVAVSWHVETYTNRMGLDSWKQRAENGGATLNSFGSHVFHYLEWLFGPIRRVQCHLFPFAGREEAIVNLSLELLDGTPLSVSASTVASMGTGHRLEIYGDAGTLVLENPTGDYAAGFRLLQGICSSGCLESVPGRAKGGADASADGRVAAVARLVNRFLGWIVDGDPTEPSLQHGLRVQRLLDAARRANSAAAWVDVAPPDPALQLP